MGKLDTAGIEFLEGEPLEAKPYKAYKRRVQAIKPAKKPVNTLQGVSSYRLVRELTHRHYKFVVRAVFYMGLGAVIVIITRG